MLGLAERAFLAGWNAVRLNQRNCGGTESLTPTLYNSGLSGDYRAVLWELIERDALPMIFFAGYSMGGNLVLKMAGELAGSAPRQLRGVAAVCPCIDLALCADAVGLPANFIYQRHFVFREFFGSCADQQRPYPGGCAQAGRTLLLYFEV
jgi:predicted alpha/beta-fold hydrolase